MSQVRDILSQQKTETQFFILGKAFFGEKDISQKDGSYTATLWMTFLNIPFYPIDSYRILNTEHNLLPKVYGLDEYILVKSVGIKFDLSQVIWTFAVVYGSIVVLSYLNIYLFIEYGTVHGYGFSAALIGIYSSLLVWNHRTLNPSLHVMVRPTVKVEKVQPIQKVGTVSYVPEIELEEVPELHEPVISAPQIKSIEPVVSEPIITPSPAPAAVHIETESNEPRFELAPQLLDGQVPKKPVKLSMKIHKYEDQLFNPIPKPAISYAAAKSAAPAVITQHVDVPGQMKFDPNKIMEWDPKKMDMQPKQILYSQDHMRFADWVALITVIALMAQVLTRFYFILNPHSEGDMAIFQSVFDVLYTYYALSIAGSVLFIFTVRNSPYLAYPMMFLSLLYFFRLEIILYNFLSTL